MISHNIKVSKMLHEENFQLATQTAIRDESQTNVPSVWTSVTKWARRTQHTYVYAQHIPLKGKMPDSSITELTKYTPLEAYLLSVIENDYQEEIRQST